MICVFTTMKYCWKPYAKQTKYCPYIALILSTSKKNASGNSKTGSLRARFLIEAVADLRKNLQGLGGDLIVRTGNPAEILPQLAEQYQVNEVYHHREVAHEETDISEQVEAALWKMKLNLKHFIGHTLYHKEDLPFPIKDIPDSFAVFKKKVERDSNVRPCIGTPEQITTPEITDAGKIPTLEVLGLDEPAADLFRANIFTGGETTALLQLQKFFDKTARAGSAKSAKASAVELSSQLSPWVAIGCISLRQVYWEVIKHQQSNSSPFANVLLLDLLWRDYFRFMFKKHGQKFIAVKETDEANDIAENQDELFETWKNGETGIPMIDAIMHQLNTSGFINKHTRQTTALFLVNELKVDWMKGAAYFEEKLIDYSPASNWGNWAFIAGVNDARESKYNVTAKPANELETKSDYIDTWLPVLKDADYQPYGAGVAAK